LRHLALIGAVQDTGEFDLAEAGFVGHHGGGDWGIHGFLGEDQIHWWARGVRNHDGALATPAAVFGVEGGLPIVDH